MTEQNELSPEEITEEMRLAVEGELTPDPEELGEGDPTPEYTPAEQEAISMGWNPEGVEGKRNISAEEFVERKSLFDRIHKLERQTKTSDKVITALKKYNEQISEKAYERALTELKQQKYQALEEGDTTRVIELDDEIEKVRAEKPQPIEEEVSAQEAYAPEEWNRGFTEFASQNVWYGRRPDMTQTADRLGAEFKEQNPDVSPEELFTYVKSEITSQFKDFFEEKPISKVDSGTRRSKATAQKKSIKDIPEEDREIALTLIRTGTISEEEYLKSYFGE